VSQSDEMRWQEMSRREKNETSLAKEGRKKRDEYLRIKSNAIAV